MQKITDDIIETIATILVEEKKINIKNFGSLNIVYKKKEREEILKLKLNTLLHLDIQLNLNLRIL